MGSEMCIRDRNRTTAANFFPPNFVALLCHVMGMRTKVQMIDFVLVVVVVVGSKGLYCFAQDDKKILRRKKSCVGHVERAQPAEIVS